MRTPGKLPGARGRFIDVSLGSDVSESIPASRKFQARPPVRSGCMIPTADHDEGSPPFYGAPLGFLVPVLLDGRLVMLPPGDPVAQHLVGADAGGGLMPSPTPNKKPAAATIRDRLIFVFSTTHPLTKEQMNVYYHTSCAPFKPH